jgi:hypothetical protein
MYRSTLKTEEVKTMPIENRNLEPGAKLIATYKKETYHALVVAGPEGKVLYQLSPYDGREYKSPSALGTAVTGKSCNGWAFWSVAHDEAQVVEIGTAAVETTAASPEEPAETDTPAAPASEAEEPAEEDSEPESTYVEAGAEFTKPTDRPRFHKVPNQKNVDQGQVRLHCYTCRSSFIVPEDQNPDTCPMGHEPV